MASKHFTEQSNVKEYTVAEVSEQVRTTFKNQFGRIRVRGEISSLSLARSGHIYLNLKQDAHVLAGVIWKSRTNSIRIKPKEGLEYVATGRLTSYSGQSRYQLDIDQLELAGDGELLARLEQLKAQLQAEGLFDSAHKQNIPKFPGIIGVVTSPSGAVIKDITRVLRDRFPSHVLLWPVSVQGPRCAEEIANAIRGFNRLRPNGRVPRPDLVIVARGGGSVEDLAGFSEEIVVRAAFESRIPLISAVGHETDTPLIDLAADLRAPTPSVAAEKSVPSLTELATSLTEHHSKMSSVMSRQLDHSRQRLKDLARGLPRLENILAQPAQRLDQRTQELSSAIDTRLRSSELKLTRITPRLAQPSVVTNARRDLAVALSKLRPRLIKELVESGAANTQAAMERLARKLEDSISNRQGRVDELGRLLETLSYSRVLERGYVVVADKKSGIVSSAKSISHPELVLQFHDGEVDVRMVEQT